MTHVYDDPHYVPTGKEVKHAYLETGGGKPLVFREVAEGEHCAMCSKGPHKTPMAHDFHSNDRVWSLHCVKCGYKEQKPASARKAQTWAQRRASGSVPHS